MKTTNPKIIFIMGATGSGKSKLSVDIATRFPAEIINSDKIQAYDGLDIVTNKIPVPERNGVPHHLLGIISDPAADFSAATFSAAALSSATEILAAGKIPVVAGGSNSFLEAFVESPAFRQANLDPLFLVLDVDLPVLYRYVDARIDDMLAAGLVDEIEGFFEPGADFSRGIWRAIGVPEMEKYLAAKTAGNQEAEYLLAAGVEAMKENTRRLVWRQVEKIQRLSDEAGWDIRRLDATEVFESRCNGGDVSELWNEIVLNPSLAMVGDFLKSDCGVGVGGGEVEAVRMVMKEKKMVAI